MGVSIGGPVDPDEVYRLRYDVYVAEFGRLRAYADRTSPLVFYVRRAVLIPIVITSISCCTASRDRCSLEMSVAARHEECIRQILTLRLFASKE